MKDSRLRWVLFFFIGLVGACRKDMQVHKDDSAAVLQVKIKTIENEAVPFEVRYTSAGWMVFQEGLTPYMQRFDSTGQFKGSAEPAVKAKAGYKETLDVHESGTLYRCTTLPNDASVIVLQQLDGNFNVQSQTEMLDLPEDIIVTGFQCGKGDIFLFSFRSKINAFSEVYIYESTSGVAVSLVQKSYCRLVDYILDDYWDNHYLVISNYKSGSPAHVLVLNNGLGKISEVAMSGYTEDPIANHNTALYSHGSSGPVLVYNTSYNLAKIMSFNEMGELQEGPAPMETGYMYQLKDIQIGPNGWIWILHQEQTYSTGELVLTRYRLKGTKDWTRNLAGTGMKANAICALRLIGNHDWQILGQAGERQENQLNLIDP